MNDGTVIIDSLPRDNALYVVTSYGGVIKNHSYASDIPLVKVTLNKIQNNSIKSPTISSLVGLPELSTVRIGTIWQNQKRLERYWSKYKNYEEHISIFFDLKKHPAKSVRYVKQQNGNKTKLIPVEVDDNHIEDNRENEFYRSTFTEFTSEDGIKYIVSSIELLMSTYIPKNKLIRNDLLLYDVEVVIQRYIEAYNCSKDCYTIYLEKILEKETMAFLAYLACNKKSKANISKLWASIESRSSLNEKHINVLPYHPETISFKASGVWLDESTFYIQRIYNPKPPSEKRFQVLCTRNTVGPGTNARSGNNINQTKEKNTPKSTLNQNRIKDRTAVVSNRSPGGKAGTKYIVSEVVPNNEELDMEIIEAIKVGDSNSNQYIKETKNVEAASSGRLSGSNDSEKVAMTKYIVEEDPKRLDYAIEIENSLNELVSEGFIKSIKYIDDFAVEHNQLVYASFNQDYINLNGNKRWVSGYIKGSGIKKSNAGYRKLLIIKINMDIIKPFYLIEIIRKIESDKFKGIVFQLANTADQSILEDIKRVIATNKGHFNKGKRPFPVKKSAQYKHKWGNMKKRFENIFEAIKEKKIFE